MGLLRFFRRRESSTSEQRLIGLWSAPGVEIDIRPDGTMDYTTIEYDKRQIMKLTYRIDGDEIVSNQPSAPREERTKFWFENDQLVLMFGGERTSYRRASL